MKYVREIFDMIFSYGTVMLIMLSLLVYTFIVAFNAEERNRELYQKQTAYCYSQNMVVVDTDAGRLCTPASSLKAIK